MQARRISLGALALLVTGVAGFATGKSFPQDAPMAQAGKEHKWLATHAGDYTAKVGGMMGESEGTNKIESVLGGLWIVTHFESSMMGQPFKGMEIMGYDPGKEKFVSVWVDSMSTTLSPMEGTYDAEAKTLTMKGQSVGQDGEVGEMVNVTEYKESGMAFTMSMAGPDGGLMPMMTIDYTRKK